MTMISGKLYRIQKHVLEGGFIIFLTGFEEFQLKPIGHHTPNTTNGEGQAEGNA